MSIEDTIKQEILSQYKSVRAFTQALNIPYSTIDSMLKKGVRGTAVQTVIRVCDSLGLDLNAISCEILYDGLEKRRSLNSIEGPSNEAMEVAFAYDKANFKDKNTARHALALPLLPESDDLSKRTSSASDKQSSPISNRVAEAEEEYIKSRSGGARKTASSASTTTDGKNEKAV